MTDRCQTKGFRDKNRHKCGERDHVIHSPVGRRDQRRRVITQRGKRWKGSPEAKKEDRGRRDSLTRGASGDGVKAWQQS